MTPHFRWLISAVSLPSLLLLTASAMAGPPPLPEVRYSVGLFHFNIQYCAGGLDGFPESLGLDFGDWPTDEASVEDAIIRESFLPVLDILERHPTWAFSIEMQGRFAEVLMTRFPSDLVRLKNLVDGGQVELISFHYSDQLFLAWPPQDLIQSLDLNDAVFAEAGLTVSPAVFVQEGQFSPGMAPLMEERGRNLLLMPKNLFSYWHPGVTPEPWYSLDGVDVMLAGRGFEAAEGQVSLHYTFFNDGELMATGELSCYLGPAFVARKEAIAAYEEEVQADEDNGYVVGTLAGFRDALRDSALVAPPAALPPSPDGTWQPDDTQNVGRWMGGLGSFGDSEMDNLVLTEVAAARSMVAAAHSLVESLDPGSSSLVEADRELALAQVSDSTGWSPFDTEVAYARGHAETARTLAEEVALTLLEKAGAAPGSTVRVDSATGAFTEVVEGSDPPFSLTDAPLKLSALAEDRTVTLTWEQSTADSRHARVTVALSAASEGSSQRTASVSFPLSLDVLRWTPALFSDRVEEIPLADLRGGDSFTVSLANGLLGLAESTWLIKETATVHLAALVSAAEGTVTFSETTLLPEAGQAWRFHVLADATTEEALALASSLNEFPEVDLTLPEIETPGDDDTSPSGDDDTNDEDAPSDGCGCVASGLPSSPLHPQNRAPLLVLVGMGVIWGRRARRSTPNLR